MKTEAKPVLDFWHCPPLLSTVVLNAKRRRPSRDIPKSRRVSLSVFIKRGLLCPHKGSWQGDPPQSPDDRPHSREAPTGSPQGGSGGGGLLEGKTDPCGTLRPISAHRLPEKFTKWPRQTGRVRALRVLPGDREMGALWLDIFYLRSYLACASSPVEFLLALLLLLLSTEEKLKNRGVYLRLVGAVVPEHHDDIR
jgi:hypothetical protein